MKLIKTDIEILIKAKEALKLKQIEADNTALVDAVKSAFPEDNYTVSQKVIPSHKEWSDITVYEGQCNHSPLVWNQLPANGKRRQKILNKAVRTALDATVMTLNINDNLITVDAKKSVETNIDSFYNKLAKTYSSVNTEVRVNFKKTF